MTPNTGMPAPTAPTADMPAPGSAINANMPADPAPVADAQQPVSDASMGMGAASAPVSPAAPATTAPMDTTATAVPGAMPAADENGNQPAQ